MVTYRYGIDAPGGLVPVHALMLNFYLNLANPKESPLLELLDDMDLCD